MEAEVLGTDTSTEAATTTEAFRVGPFDDPDRYEIGEPVEAGAEGILYRGQLLTPTSRLSLPVAVKALQPVYAARIDQWAARWRDQVELLRSLQIPGLVGVREGFVGPLPHRQGADTAGRNLYLVMNWVEGEALDHWVLRHRGVDVGNALKLLLPVAVAVDTMHGGQLTGSVPIVHRDIKPANILIGKGGSVLVDFGLTKGLSIGHPVGRAGTPGYIAPEVLAGAGYTPAADRYAFGATVFFLLTGRHPATPAQAEELRHQLETSPLGGGAGPGGVNAAIPPELVERVLAMLDPDPARRPAALANWIAQLRQSSLDDEVLTVRLAPPAPARPRRGRSMSAGRSTSAPTYESATTWPEPDPLGGSNPSGSSGSYAHDLPAGPAALVSLSNDTAGTPAARAPVVTGGKPRGGAHRARRSPVHARHQRVLTSGYTLAVLIAAAVTVIAGDAGAISRPSTPSAGHLALSPAPTGAGGSSLITRHSDADDGQLGATGGLPIGQPEENAKNLPAPTPTTVAYPGAASCVESTKPACGPVKWSPPVSNQPLSVTFSYSPQSPMVGQPVTFTIAIDDPDDANGLQINGAYFGDQPTIVGSEGGVTPVAGNGPAAGCQTPYGTWRPPARGAPGHLEKQMTFTYANPGTYSVHFTASSGEPANSCAPYPYASPGQSAVQTVTVSSPPPPPPATTTTSTSTTTVPDTTTTTTPTTASSS